jgi:hypothetical protein
MLSQRIPAGVRRLRLLRQFVGAIVASFVISLCGCSDYFKQREMNATLASWIGDAEAQRVNVMNMVAASAHVKPSCVEDDSPLHQAICDRTVIWANGYEFSRQVIHEGRYIYRRQDGRMSVLLTKESDDPRESWLVFVSQLDFVE